MPLTEPDVRILRIRLFNDTSRAKLYLPCSNAAHGAILRFCERLFHCPVLISPLTPSSGLPALTGHYSGYAFTTSQSDYPASPSPPCLFSLLETCSIAPAGFSQVSDINSLITRHDLRPRPVSTCSPNYACFVIGFQNMKSLTSDNMEYFGAPSLHLRYG